MEVVTGLRVTVSEILENLKRGNLETKMEKPEDPGSIAWKIEHRGAPDAVRSALNLIRNLLPVMIGVVLLVGLFFLKSLRDALPQKSVRVAEIYEQARLYLERNLSAD